MPRNLELKIKCKSFSKTKKILKEIKADYIGILMQKDIYYKINKGLLKLRIENGQKSLIKYVRDETGKDRWSDFQVLKFAEGNTEKFFGSLFNIQTIVEKKRYLFLHDDTRIHLDEVKYLGKFLEIETLVLNGLKDAKYRFNIIQDKLELDLSNQIRNSYKILMEEKNK
jgi:adenylate cyclase, class 2